MNALVLYLALAAGVPSPEGLLVLDLGTAWLVLGMVIVVTSGILWLLTREFHPQGKLTSSPASRKPAPSLPGALPRRKWRAA